MSRHYIYIFSDTKRESIHCGYCKDILKAVKHFGEMPTILLFGERQNILVHLEIADNEPDAKQRFDEIFKMNMEQKHECILSQNPTWKEIIIGKDIDI